MAITLKIFSLYKTRVPAQDCNEFVLLRTIKPGYPSYNANLERLADEIEDQKRQHILATLTENNFVALDLIGEFQQVPLGDDVLFSMIGAKKIAVVYAQSTYGFPWITIGSFETIGEFNAELALEEDLAQDTVPNSAIKILADLYVENDFDLTSIPYSQIQTLPA